MSAPPFVNTKHDYLPAREGDLLNWSRNFSDQLNVAPESLGVTVAQAAQYAALNDAYAAAYMAATNPSTNSKSSVVVKNEAKAALKANARMLARIIRAMPTVTNDQRVTLGLAVADEHLTPVTVSDDKPLLMLMTTMGRTVRLRIRSNASTFRRARPQGMIGALILSYVAVPHSPEETAPPESVSRWSYCGHAMRSRFQVTLPADVPAGSKVWIAACWVNTRGGTGPFSAAVSTRIGDGVGNFAGALRLAA